MRRVDEIKQQLRKKPKGLVPLSDDKFLSTGSTLLNLACTGRTDGGFIKGHYILFVGDSDSGKTFLSLTCLAEATLNRHFKDYRLIYDAPEGGALMDIERFFGKRVADRLEPPAGDRVSPIHSQTVEDFYYNIDDALKRGPFIYVLDSQDCLTSKAEVEKFKRGKRAARKERAGEDAERVAGSYGDGKAKAHSSNLRRLMGPLQESGSILIVVNQTRDSFDPFEKSTHSGGRALKFYATLQLWSSPAGKLDKTVNEKKRQLGIVARVKVKKNRITGRDRSVLVNIFHSCGLDDTGSMVQYLIGEKYWKAVKGKVTATGLGPEFVGSEEKVVRWIEDGNREGDLRELVGVVWSEIERQCEVHRKSRYGG
jgi:hypothetical protein